jgi:PleD family two-component response regulator
MTDAIEHPPVILVANDQEWSGRSIETVLQAEGYAIVRAFTGSQVIDKLRTHRLDALILDQQLPDLSGFDLTRAVRDDPALGPTIPIIITTAGPSGRANRIAAFEAGAWDFIPFPLDGEMLLLRLRNYLAAKRMTDAIRRDGLFDPTAGVYNRRGFEVRSREVLVEGSRRGATLSCLVIDVELDPVRRDRLVEAIVEEQTLSQQVAAVLRRNTRAADVVAKVDTLRFAVLAAATEPDGARRLFERFTAGLEASGLAMPVRLRMALRIVDGAEAGTLSPDDLIGGRDASAPEGQVAALSRVPPDSE